MNKKIIFSGGGTGGHIFPAINLMKHFFDKEYKVILVTDNRGNNFIKKVFFLFFNFLFNLKINFYFKKRKTKFNIRIWRLCIFSYFFCF